MPGSSTFSRGALSSAINDVTRRNIYHNIQLHATWVPSTEVTLSLCTGFPCKQPSRFAQHGRLHCLVSSQTSTQAACVTDIAATGYDQGVLGGLIALPNFLEANHISANDADLQGTIVAIYDIGCLTGCIIAGFVGQKLGRRLYIVLGGVLLVVGAGLQAGARGSSYLIGGRVIGGIGMGMSF